ncbi:unnamed protein product [Leptosia nina]|uniref:Methuselah N-terminal domain-containing protein n=1 Tax=Leptosia nina TaxID=320188 RepID=A0AAV1JRY5_9NEOP
MFRLLLIVISFFNVNGQLCGVGDRLDLTDSETFTDGSIVKNGIRFPPKYVFSQNVSGEIKTFGCPCEFKTCYKKCCPLGKVFHKSENASGCVEMYDVLQSAGMRLHFFDNYKRSVDLAGSGEFVLLTGIPCDGDVYIEDGGPWYVQEVSILC